MPIRQQMCRLVACGLPIVLAACGGGALQLSDVTPQSVPSLEAARAQHPQDVNASTRLGVAYFRANRLDDARRVLDTVVVADPQNGVAAMYRGMTAEAQGDFVAARASYSQVAVVGKTRELKNVARQRLALVGRRELEFQARTALAQEAQLSQTPPEPNTIAVMPFTYSGSNADIQPLSRGFAQLVVTDLAKSGHVRVLERERMQAMLDEMHLGENGSADPATAARSGRMLRAARVVQGTLLEQGTVLRVDAAVVDVSSTTVAEPVRAADQLSRLFDMEKSLVIQLFQNLGITLTEAERLSINQRPTQNIQAFLSWSRGLEAEDRGDFAGAQQFYDQATRIDPGFLSAQQSSAKAADISAASSASAQSVDATVTQSVSSESGTGSDNKQTALTNATNNTNPPPGPAPTPTGTPTSGSQPSTQTNPQDKVIPPSPALPTGTLTITLKRP